MLKDPIRAIYRPLNKPHTNQKVVKASDIKLNDVLINGVQLHCFKVIKNKPTFLTRRNPFELHHFKEQGSHETVIIEDDTLFKNKAIKKRLRSLENEQTPSFNTNYEPFLAKKTSFRTRQTSKVPIDKMNPSGKERLGNQEVFNKQKTSSKGLDINRRYYSQLNKQLMMYSANNRFNSTTVKNKVQFGKYIGFKMGKQKMYTTQRQSAIIQQKMDKCRKKDQFKRNSETFYASLDSKKSVDAVYQSAIQREKQKEQGQQRLKICYSTKYQFKRWKDLMNEKNNTVQTDRSQKSEANPEQKLTSTMIQQ